MIGGAEQLELIQRGSPVSRFAQNTAGILQDLVGTQNQSAGKFRCDVPCLVFGEGTRNVCGDIGGRCALGDHRALYFVFIYIGRPDLKPDAGGLQHRPTGSAGGGENYFRAPEGEVIIRHVMIDSNAKMRRNCLFTSRA